jgi:hypothetical protein
MRVLLLLHDRGHLSVAKIVSYIYHSTLSDHYTVRTQTLLPIVEFTFTLMLL